MAPDQRPIRDDELLVPGQHPIAALGDGGDHLVRGEAPSDGPALAASRCGSANSRTRVPSPIRPSARSRLAFFTSRWRTLRSASVKSTCTGFLLTASTARLPSPGLVKLGRHTV